MSEPGSLTDRLVATGLGFAVDPMFLGIDQASGDEADLLGLECGARVMARHVALTLAGEVVVVARSLCRADCPKWTPILDRGGRSLGLTLFGDGVDIVRGHLSFLEVAAPHPLFALVRAHCRDTQRVPARRCRFIRADATMIVQEAFLPALEARLAAT